VADSGGTPTAVTKLDEAQAETSHRWPYFLPDGRHFLYFVRGKELGVHLGSLDSPEKKLILPTTSNAAFSLGGHLLWWREGSLLAQPFDARRLELTGSPVLVAEHVLLSATQNLAAFSVSQNGILVLQTGGILSGDQLTWFERSGKQAGKIIVEQANLAHPRISPDGQRIAVTAVDVTGNTRDIWLFDLARNVHTRLTCSQSSADAVWSPDGSRVAYSTNDASGGSLFVKSATGTTGEELLLHIPGTVRPWSWSADGRFIAYMQRPTQARAEVRAEKFDIWILPLFGERKPFMFLQSDYEKDTPSFSPNGRWMAYSSTESGSAEVYVVSFPDATTKVQVSNQGGFSPVWRRDGKELFYVSIGGELTTVSVENSGSRLRLGSPVTLFPTDFTLSRGSGPVFQRQPFDVSPKGERFVATASSLDASKEVLPVTVVANWDAKLKKQ
jgi:hypothetical protein